MDAPVELDQHFEVVVRAVGQLMTGGSLPCAARQSVSQLNVPDVEDLEQRVRPSEVAPGRRFQLGTPSDAATRQPQQHIVEAHAAGLATVRHDGQCRLELGAIANPVKDGVLGGDSRRLYADRSTRLCRSAVVQSQT
jgi:hypothetical protein